MKKSDKVILSLSIAILIAVFFVGRCNGIRSVTKTVGIDTTTKTNSEVIRYKPVPYKVTVHDTVKLKYKFPFYIGERVGVGVGSPMHIDEWLDTSDIWHIDTSNVYWIKEGIIHDNCWDSAFYDTTLYFKGGSARLIDTVNRNRISGRGMKLTTMDTLITKTTVLTPKPKAILYWDIAAMSNFNAGTGMSLKLGNDFIFGADVFFSQSKYPLWMGKVSIPLRTKKH